MAGFPSVRHLVEAEDNGQTFFTPWRKVPSQATTQGYWFDMSMSPGNPAPQYYAATPLSATPLSRSTDGGILHGGNVSPTYKKFLRKLSVMSSNSTTWYPASMMLLDYLMFYPFVDESTIGVEQTMTNIQTLPRYSDGKGVQIMLVVVAAQASSGQTITINYTNSDGVSGRTTRVSTSNAITANGTIYTAETTTGRNGPFIGLQAGDTGVRSVEGVTLNTVSDVGLFSVVLVKPIAQLQILDYRAPVEIDYLKDFSQCPEIKDDAYLNFIICPNGSLSGVPLCGYIQTVWN